MSSFESFSNSSCVQLVGYKVESSTVSGLELKSLCLGAHHSLYVMLSLFTDYFFLIILGWIETALLYFC
jgi:hypothetical protein